METHKVYVYLIPITLLFVLQVKGAEYRTVNLPSGSIRGVLVNVPAFATSVYQYKGIPYAEPPLGNLRFQKPKPITPWAITFNATEFGPICPQNTTDLTKNISEDCLTLNIYVPQNANSSDNKSVMVFIHGGGYIIGAGQYYDGSDLALSGDVILVTINYRLGFLGFMSTMDSASRGNYGLWDQQLAIKWVKNNIEAFGGNPSSITIFGESAGGFSVALQALHSGNKGLFQNVIAESGVANSNFAFTKVSRTTSFKIGGFVGCNTSNSSELVQCLRQKSFNEILHATGVIYQTPPGRKVNFVTPLGPNMDKEFLEDNPAILLQDKATESNKFFRSLNLIVGCVNAEGSLLLSFMQPFENIYSFNKSEGIPYDFLCNAFAAGLTSDYFPQNVYSKIWKQICNFYKSQESETGAMPEQGRNAVNLFGDFFFYAPALYYLDAHQLAGNTYQFMFTMPGDFGYGAPYPSWFQGAGHVSELAYLFEVQRLKNKREDYILSIEMMKYWTNFAKTGNPNGNNTNVTWPEYTSSTQAYLDLNNPVSQKDHVFRDRMTFWRITIPSIIKTPPNINKSVNISSSKINISISLFAVLLVCMFMK